MRWWGGGRLQSDKHDRLVFDIKKKCSQLSPSPVTKTELSKLYYRQCVLCVCKECRIPIQEKPIYRLLDWQRINLFLYNCTGWKT